VKTKQNKAEIGENLRFWLLAYFNIMQHTFQMYQPTNILQKRFTTIMKKNLKCHQP